MGLLWKTHVPWICMRRCRGRYNEKLQDRPPVFKGWGIRIRERDGEIVNTDRENEGQGKGTINKH